MTELSLAGDDCRGQTCPRHGGSRAPSRPATLARPEVGQVRSSSTVRKEQDRRGGFSSFRTSKDGSAQDAALGNPRARWCVEAGPAAPAPTSARPGAEGVDLHRPIELSEGWNMWHLRRPNREYPSGAPGRLVPQERGVMDGEPSTVPTARGRPRHVRCLRYRTGPRIDVSITSEPVSSCVSPPNRLGSFQVLVR